MTSAFSVKTRNQEVLEFFDGGERGLVWVMTSLNGTDALYTFPKTIYSKLVAMIKTDLAYVGPSESILQADFVTAYVLAGKEATSNYSLPVYSMTLTPTQRSEINRLLNRETWKKLNFIEYQYSYSQLLVDQAGTRYYLLDFEPYKKYVRVETDHEVQMFLVEGTAVQDTIAYVINTYVPKAPDPFINLVHITKASLAAMEMGWPDPTQAFSINSSQTKHLMDLMKVNSWRECVDIQLGFGSRNDYALYSSKIDFGFSEYLGKTWIHIIDRRDPTNVKTRLYFADISILSQVKAALEEIQP